MAESARKLENRSFDIDQIDFAGLADLFQDLPLEVAMYNSEGIYRFVNRQYAKDEKLQKSLIGKDDSYFFKNRGISEECVQKRKEYFKRAVKERRMIKFTEKLFVPEEDKTLYYRRMFKPVFSTENGNALSYIFLFGTNLNAAILGQKELRYLAYHDKLTGLRNRAAFYDRLHQIHGESSRVDHEQLTAVLFIDLDNFKLVNETLGHNSGDRLLQEISSRLKLCIRKTDSVYRFGGDQFAAILKNINQEHDAGRIAEKFTKYVSKPYFIDKHKINYITSSVGIVLYPRDGDDVEILIKNADTAMFSAKKRGKNTFQFFSKAMTEYSVKRLKIEKNLTTLVNKNEYDEQFKVLYQPIVEKTLTGDYKVIGAEALLRWHNKELGLVRPDTFIPIAEEANLISDIGEWIFHKTCHEFNKLNLRRDFPLYLSINFSARQLRSTDMLHKLEKIIAQTGFDPAFLQLELTETSYLDDHIEVTQNLRELEEMGIQIALDDFGVGFASLSYLHKVPANTIKIDRSFIRYLSTSKRYKDLVKSIILLGETLNKDVIAEGVEQVEDLYILDANKCYKYQGFLFSEPISLNDFEVLTHRENLLTTLISE